MQLNIAGERIFPVSILDLPPRSKGLSLAEAMNYAAIRLFVDRAELAASGSVLDDTTAPEIAAICIRLDGIALAIELAAARIRMLRPGELLARLNDRFRLLTGGARSALPRQQTLRAMIDWSFALLTNAEQVALRRLAIFAGGFTIGSAEAVIAGGLVVAEDVFELIAALLDKSLLVKLPQTIGETRFRLLETTRHYGLEKLDKAGETATLQRRFAVHMVDLFQQARERRPDSHAGTLSAAYELEADNLRAALDWAFRPEGDPAIGVALAARIWIPLRSGYLTRQERWAVAQKAIAKLTPDTPALDEAWLRQAVSYLGLYLGYSSDHASALRAHDLFRATGNAALVGLSAVSTAWLLTDPKNPVEARLYMDEAKSVLNAIPPNRDQAIILQSLGVFSCVSCDDGWVEAARACFAQALNIYKTFEDHEGISEVRKYMDLPEVIRENQEAAASNQTAVQHSTRRDGKDLGFSRTNFMAFELMSGNLAGAQAAAREAVPLAIRHFDLKTSVNCIGYLALLAAQLGALGTAARLAGFNDNFFATTGKEREFLEQRLWASLLDIFAQAASNGVLSDADCTQLMAEGAALSREDALTLGLEL